jgi:hypothetical protein
MVGEKSADGRGVGGIFLTPQLPVISLTMKISGRFSGTFVL